MEAGDIWDSPGVTRQIIGAQKTTLEGELTGGCNPSFIDNIQDKLHPSTPCIEHVAPSSNFIKSQTLLIAHKYYNFAC